jgi:MarR family transcriptional regulator, 2-MHQ and catechol-resistance regulon repressor
VSTIKFPETGILQVMGEPIEEEGCCELLGAGAGDDPITLVGLVFESAAGLRRNLGPSLEQQVGVGGLAFEVLLRLSRSPGGTLRMSDLAAQTGLTPSGLTRALDRLVATGLCSRESCETDRRVTFATLTPTGRDRISDAVARHSADIDALLTDLYDDAERAVLCTLLRRLRDRVHPDAALVSALAEPAADR